MELQQNQLSKELEFELCSAAEVSSHRTLNIRAGLPNFKQALLKKDSINVAYVGGSVTAQRGWRERSMGWLRASYPSVEFTEFNCSRGGYNAIAANNYFKYEVLVHQPTIVFLEFVVTEYADLPAMFSSIENIVRDTRLHIKPIDLCFVNCSSPRAFRAALSENSIDDRIAIVELLANYYQITSINFIPTLVKGYNDESLIYDRTHAELLRAQAHSSGQDKSKTIFSIDGKHPIYGSGDLVYATIFAEAIESILSDAPGTSSYSKLPTRLTDPPGRTSFSDILANVSDDVQNLSGMYNLYGDMQGLGSKKELRTVALPANSLSGNFPPLGECPELQYFIVHQNQITGTINTLQNNPALLGLECSNNLLSGPLPDLSICKDLLFFRGGKNQFDNTIPAFRANDKLTTYDCHSNCISGRIPSLASLMALERFDCRNNKLSGNIPDLDDNKKLTHFRCDDNLLSGHLPSLTGNANLQVFTCSKNNLRGSLPSFGGNLNLNIICCAKNALSGELPDLQTNDSLVEFNVAHNQFHGALPMVRELKFLSVLNCSHNQFSKYLSHGFSLPTIQKLSIQGNLLLNEDILRILHDLVETLAVRKGRTCEVSLSYNPHSSHVKAIHEHIVTLEAAGWNMNLFKREF